MKIGEIQSLNTNLTNDKIDMPYPHLYIQNPSDAVALVLTALPRGDLSVICEHKGIIKRIGSIEMSAISLKKLSKVCQLSFYCTADNSYEVKTPDSIMEVIEAWMQL